MKPAAFQMFSETGWAYTFMSIVGVDQPPRACAVGMSIPDARRIVKWVWRSKSQI